MSSLIGTIPVFHWYRLFRQEIQPSTGTAKSRVDLPVQICSKSFKLKDDEIRAYYTYRLLPLGAAQKKKPVIMLSSEEPTKVVSVHTRRDQEVWKPQVVHHYNQSMNGVDTADQCCVYYFFIRRSKKWWQKVFWLFEVMVVNSYTLYKIMSPQKLTHLETLGWVGESGGLYFGTPHTT